MRRLISPLAEKKRGLGVLMFAGSMLDSTMGGDTE